MTKNPSPKEAFEYFKALSPEVTGISKQGECNCVVQVGKAGHQWIEFVTIDWPEGVDQWPPKEPERKWRQAERPNDFGKKARFRKKDEPDFAWLGTISGMTETEWLCNNGLWWDIAEVEDIPAEAETPPPNYMLEALRFALNTLDGCRVRMQNQWPVLAAILPETIAKVKDAIERAEADLGAQRQPSSVAKIQAEAKAVARELENVGGCCQVPTKQHPADREPTDEEVCKVCQYYDPWLSHVSMHVYAWEDTQHKARKFLMAWQQVWRESK